MTRAGWWGVALAASGGAAAAFAVRAAVARWQRDTRALADRIAAAADRSDGPARVGALDQMPSLPAPVRRYLRRTLHDHQRRIRLARFGTAGTFRRIEPGDGRLAHEGWVPFTATQTCGVDPAAFVWDARVRLWPLVPVFVRDACVEGRGSTEASVLGVVPVAGARGAPEIDSGALLRYLAESAWLPTALLPGPHLTWAPLDEDRARATLRAGPAEVSAVFEFTREGDLAGVSAERYMATRDGYLLAPWHGRFTQHETRAGMRIPTQGEVSWVLDGRERPYWRGALTSVAYEFAEDVHDVA